MFAKSKHLDGYPGGRPLRTDELAGYLIELDRIAAALDIRQDTRRRGDEGYQCHGDDCSQNRPFQEVFSITLSLRLPSPPASSERGLPGARRPRRSSRWARRPCPT